MKRMALIVCMLGTLMRAAAQTPGPGAAAAATNAVDPRLAAFNEELAEAKRAVESLTPETLMKLLSSSRDLGMPQAAAGLTRAYLARQAEPSQALLLLAARNALLSGE